MPDRSLPRAFHPKARSHFTITALDGGRTIPSFHSAVRIAGNRASAARPVQKQSTERGDRAMRPGFGAKRVAVATCQLTKKKSATTRSHEFSDPRGTFAPKPHAHCPVGARTLNASRTSETRPQMPSNHPTVKAIKKPAKAGFSNSQKANQPMCNPPFTEKSAPVV